MIFFFSAELFNRNEKQQSLYLLLHFKSICDHIKIANQSFLFI